jgi:cephalosporin hydroxylase
MMEESLNRPLRDILEVLQERSLTRSTYFGIPAVKNPLDFWIYREIIFEQRPDVIIEIGTHCGGTTLALAHICDSMDHGQVIGIDISHARVADQVKSHVRITLIEGDACQSFEEVQDIINETDNVLIIEDSAHIFSNTLNVLETYSPLIKPGGYFIVEDSICHHGLNVGPYPGPYEAIEQFLEINSDFESDRSREPIITWNPKGYLRRRCV